MARVDFSSGLCKHAHLHSVYNCSDCGNNSIRCSDFGNNCVRRIGSNGYASTAG